MPPPHKALCKGLRSRANHRTKSPHRRIEKHHIAPRRPIIQTYITEDKLNKAENPLRQSAIYAADYITKRHTEHKTTIYQPGNMRLNPPNSAEHHEEPSVNCASLPCPLRWHCVSVQNGSAYARLCRRIGASSHGGIYADTQNKRLQQYCKCT